jgi:hypothetical protein
MKEYEELLENLEINPDFSLLAKFKKTVKMHRQNNENASIVQKSISYGPVSKFLKLLVSKKDKNIKEVMVSSSSNKISFGKLFNE